MQRVWILGGAVAVTLGALSVVMLVGSATFHFRRHLDHDIRLQKVMRLGPTADRLTRGLADEGAPLLLVTASADEAEREVPEDGRHKRAEVREKVVRHAETRVYLAGDMLYFVYFDSGGVMRDFTCVSR
jgi:hypothetical protein